MSKVVTDSKSPRVRLHYIDVMKGLTMLFVVLHHVLWLMGERGMNNGMIHILLEHQQLYVCFIMPVFFFVTGYCSNFEKKINSFLVPNIKLLVIPSLTIGTILELIHGRWDLWTYIKGSIYLGFYSFWFLYALLYSKLLYYVVQHFIQIIWLRLLLLLILAFIGAYLSDTNLIRNFGMVWQVLNLTIYLALGNIIRNHPKEKYIMIYGAFFYCILAILCLCRLIGMPCVTAAFSSTFQLEPLHFISAFSGCLCILYICIKIDTNKILEIIGKHSLVVYVLHCEFINLFLGETNSEYINKLGYLPTLLFVMTILLGAVSMSCLISKLLHTKYFSWMLGNFHFKL